MIDFLADARSGAHKAGLALEKVARGADIDGQVAVADRLLLGAKTELLLPWGGPSTARPINVLDLIRALKDVSPTAMDTYEFLCESCHPTFT